MRARQILVTLITLLLIFLWVYTAVAKLLDIPANISVFKRSPFLNHFAYFLAAVVPMAELVVAGLLLFPACRQKGLIGSMILLSVFTLYITGVLVFSDWVPCTCGGVIQSLSWQQHIILNLAFIFLTAIAIKYNRSKALQSGSSRKPVRE